MSNIFPIIIGYILGSIPSAYIIAKGRGVNIKTETKDGRFGATTVKRKCGFFPGVLVGAMDFSKGGLTIIIAEILSGDILIIVLSGLAAVVGHNWSLFLKFIGGKGGAASLGEVFTLLPYPFALAALIMIGPVLFLKNKKTVLNIRVSSFLTIVFFGLISLFALCKGLSLILVFSPLIVSLPMIIKKN